MSKEVKEKALAEFRKGDQFNLELYGAPHIGFLDCERLLLPGVTLHLRFYRSPNNCALESVGTWSAADIKRVDQTPDSVVIKKDSLVINKVVLSDSVKVSIERALTKSPAVCPYFESLNKSFIIQAGQNCFVKENIFGTEPVRRLTVCMVRNKFFRGSTFENTPFQYQKFRLIKIEIQRGNGVPTAGLPIDTTKNTRLFYNTICALPFTRGGNGIEITDFEEDRYFLVFDLTSSREAGKSLTLFPEFTGASITLKLHFSEALTITRWSFFLSVNDLVKSFLTLPVTSPKTVSSLDNFTLAKVAQNCCATSRAKFVGVWSAYNFGSLHFSPPQSLKKTI